MFVHGGEELKKFGTPADFSASPFEHGNRDLQLNFSVYNTRSFDRSLHPRHLLNVVAEDHMESLAKRCNLPPTTYKSIYERPKKPVMSQSHQYEFELLPLMQYGDMAFYSVYRNGFTFKFNPRADQHSYCKVNYNGKGECLKVIIGIERNEEKFVLCSRLKVYDPINTNTFASELKDISNVLLKYQSLVFVIDEEIDEFVLVPLKNVLAFLLLFQFQNKNILVDVFERYNKT